MKKLVAIVSLGLMRGALTAHGLAALGSPFLYTIPASGARLMNFSVEGLPKGLELDPSTGRLTGCLNRKGEHGLVLQASNAYGAAEKNFRLVAGDQLALTPPMGWNSWNCWAESAEIVFNKLAYLKLTGTYRVWNLWEQKEMPEAKTSVRPHGVVLLKLTEIKQ